MTLRPHHRAACAVCGATDLRRVIDLGMHPLADTFVPAERRYEGDRVYPLVCDLCSACGQVQLAAVTDPEERYSHFDYSYTSSNSAFSRNHWTTYAADVAGIVGLAQGARVVEIGSNDGYLSARFNERGFRAFGVDPSRAMCDMATANGVDVRCVLFSEAVALDLLVLVGRVPLIVANNVVNHANDPLDVAAR